MVEQMVSSNLSKYGLGNCATIMTSSDSQPVPTMRDVQNDNKNGPFDNSALQKDEAVTQPFQAKSPPGSTSNNNNVNRNLVYARRKSDAELSNSRTSDKNRISSYQQLGDQNHIPHTEAKIKANDSVPSFSRTPANSAAARIRNCENEQSVILNSPAMDNWNARFVQLQKYLKQCDSSNPEVYLQKVRSFSTDECSRRAVELERRAIQLMLEEGREIQRVKDLNVLGKSAANHPLLRPMAAVFKSEKLV
ncbi:uncharacterized protein LOC112502402 [Cynara cardunculus var. scolymus]|uniref:Uncharacterized protein n=1 Tax=Cynara cardunculus var. scolymus TaxID=59895 RepID=A0A103XCK4_CYNCS|nr:uncharacterized protein LOC112502402 [Cynara cardunculus var. scolymus]KVH88232.1 hypothetical protein Ccrd_024361 [Cynara cardunculus var. scolymus]